MIEGVRPSGFCDTNAKRCRTSYMTFDTRYDMVSYKSLSHKTPAWISKIWISWGCTRQAQISWGNGPFRLYVLRSFHDNPIYRQCQHSPDSHLSIRDLCRERGVVSYTLLCISSISYPRHRCRHFLFTTSQTGRCRHYFIFTLWPRCVVISYLRNQCMSWIALLYRKPKAAGGYSRKREEL